MPPVNPCVLPTDGPPTNASRQNTSATAKHLRAASDNPTPLGAGVESDNNYTSSRETGLAASSGAIDGILYITNAVLHRLASVKPSWNPPPPSGPFNSIDTLMRGIGTDTKDR